MWRSKLRCCPALGRQTEQPVDKRYLGFYLACASLPFPYHVHGLISLQRSSGRFEGVKPQPRVYPALDESVVLLDDVVQIPLEVGRWVHHDDVAEG